VPLLESVLPAGAQLDHPAEVGLVEGGEDGGLLLDLDQALGDALPERRQRLPGLPLENGRRRLLGGRLGCRGGHACLVARSLGASRRRHRLHVAEDIALGQPAIPARGGDGCRVEVVLEHHALHGESPLTVRAPGCGIPRPGA
jgi:hypothetical protein